MAKATSRKKLYLRKVKQLTQSAGLIQTLYTSAGSMIASGLAAIATILITRKLGPSEFGQFSAAFSLVLILVKLNDAGLSTATTKFISSAKTKNKKAQYYNLISRYRLLLSGILLSIGILSANFLAQVLKIKPELIYLALFTSQATVYYEHLLFVLQALHKFPSATLVTISQAIGKTIFTLFFFFNLLPQQTELIFLLYMAAPSLPVLLTHYFLPDWLFHLKKSFKNQLKSSEINLKAIFVKKISTDTQRKVQNLLKHSFVGIVSAGIIENIDVLFVKAYLTDYEAGLLGGVNRVALLLYVLAYALGNVLNSRVARYKLKCDLQAYWKKAWLVLAASVVGFAASVPVAKYLILFTIGPEYLPALPIMLILLAAGFVTIGLMPFIAFFYTFDKPWYFSISGIMQLAIVVIGNGVLVPVYGLEAAAWTRLVARGVLLALTVVLARKEYGKICQQN